MLLMPGIFLAVMMLLLLLQKKTKTLSHYILMVWLILICIQQTFLLVSILNNVLPINVITITGCLLAAAHTPFLYIYAYAVIYNRLPPFLIICFAPFLVLSISLLLYHLQHPDAFFIRKGFIVFQKGYAPILSHYGDVLGATALLFTGITIYLLYKHRKAVAQTHSFAEGVSLSWLYNWAIGALVFFAASFLIIKGAVGYGWFSSFYAFEWVGGFLSFYIFYIGYFGLRQKTLIPDSTLHNEKLIKEEPAKQKTVASGVEDEENTNRKNKYKKSSLTTEDIDDYAKRIKEVLQNQKLYLDENLTLAVLSNDTGLLAHHISQTINEKLGMNFFELINSYRVEEAKQMLKDPAYNNISIEGIAYESGFKSKSAFNAFFKKQTGMTPTEFKKTQ
jgi:AraC-like DNA-binding protein